jgi:hypothetical protein
MARFVTIGYGDQAGYDSTHPDVRAAAHAHDDALQRAGVTMGIAGQPVQVRNHDDGGVVVAEGAFGAAPLPLAGFSLIEADTLEDAIEIASKSPCAVAQGVIEVWPLLAGPPPNAEAS